MNVRLVAVLVVSLAFSLLGRVYSRKTTSIAAEQGYPQFITGLRNKAEDFLTQEKIRMLVEIDDLREHDLDYRADEFFDLSKAAYFELEDDIDSMFDNISKAFLSRAADLDRKNAPEKEKIALVKKTKEQAYHTVMNELKKYERNVKNNTKIVDN